MTSRPSRSRGGQKCTANTTAGVPCKGWAVRGLNVCMAHGGAAGHARAAAARRVEAAKIDRRIGRVLAEVETQLATEGVGPLEVLENAGNRAAAMVVVISDMLDELTTLNSWGEETPTAAVGLYEKWVALAGKISKAQLDAGIAERRQQLDESVLRQLATIVETMMAGVAEWLSGEGVDGAVVAELDRVWRRLAASAVKDGAGSAGRVPAALEARRT